VAIDSPRAIQVFDAVSDLYNVRKVSRNAGSGGLLNKVAAMTFTGSWELGVTFKDTGFQPSVGALPAFETPAAFIFGPYHSIYANTKHPQEAWRLLRFLISEKYAEIWVRDGVCTPTRKSFMSRSRLQSMTSANVHPEKYLEETMNYISLVGRAQPYPVGWDASSAAFGPAVNPIWTGQQPAQQILPGLAKQLNSAMSDAQAALSNGK
jgi:multiple sugar transport system substrate-binding protein